MYNRREFLKLSGGIAGATMIAPANPNLMSDGEGDIKNFGLQLYTLKDKMPDDPKEVLKNVSLAGYKQVESYEDKKLGIFWGMKNTEFKSYLNSLGMTINSSHCDIDIDFEKKADEAAAIGMKYLICPWIEEQKTADSCKKIAAKFNNCGEICIKAGLRFGYHNHDHDFKIVDGQIVEDIYLRNTDPSLVDFEMDIYWVVTAKQDPEVWLKKYSNRFRLCHIKDRIYKATERDASTELGKGSINFPKILKTAKENGMQYFIVEQEFTPILSMKEDAEYMKVFKFK